MKRGGGPTRRPGNSAITLRRPRLRLEAAASSSFVANSRSGSSGFQKKTRAITDLAVTSKERNCHLPQLLVGKDPVTADVEKCQSIVAAVMLEKTGAVISVALANNAADSVADKGGY